MTAAFQYWREVLAAVLLCFGVYECRARDHAIARQATVELLTHEGDSLVRVYRDSLARSSAAVVRDGTTVVHFIEHWRVDTVRAWLHDTLRVAGDTTLRVAVPLPVVARADSTIRACSLLASDCAAFHRSATATITALSSENAALKSRPERSCAVPSLVTGLIGVVGGAYLRGKLP